MLRQAHLHKIFSLVIALSMVLTPVTSAYAVPANVAQVITQPIQQEETETDAGVLFRTRVVVEQPTELARLGKMGVVILDQGETWALVLADFDQLESLARLRFQPTGTDEFGTLVTANAEEHPWLAKSVAPILERSQTMRAQMASPLGALSAQGTEAVAALQSLRAAVQALTPAVQAALADSFGLDDDGDGLTNTEEGWWCTDPANPNSDGDAQGYTDGQEVHALLDFTVPREIRWGYGPPFRAWPPFVDIIAPGTTPTCLLDADKDSIPDLAEIYVVGTLSGVGDSENTDGDKFDDGQELFGTTYCPGGLTSCGYGTYPREGDSSKWQSPGMPSWVRPPGDSPFVAAYPVIEFNVDPATIVITTKEIKTIEQTLLQGTEISTGFAETKGNSTSVGTIDTNTRNGWQEHSSSVGGIEPAGNISDIESTGAFYDLRIEPSSVSSFLSLTPIGPATLSTVKTYVQPSVALSGWQDFINQTWGYRLSFPDTWTSQIAFENAMTADEDVIRQRLLLNAPNGSDITVDLWTKPKSVTLDNWLNTYQKPMLGLAGVSLPKASNAEINGIPAVVVSQPGSCMTPQLFYTYFASSDRVWAITYRATDEGKNLAVYRNLLASFDDLRASSLRPLPGLQLPNLVSVLVSNSECSSRNSTTCCSETSGNARWACSVTADGVDKGNCTWWAAKKRPDVGSAVSGNAGQWATQAHAAGFIVDTTADVGDIMVIEPNSVYTLGHVAYVTGVSGDNVTVTEMNWCSTCKQSNSYSVSGKKFIGGKSDAQPTPQSQNACWAQPVCKNPDPATLQCVAQPTTNKLEQPQKSTVFWERIGQSVSSLWGRLTGGSLRSGDSELGITTCGGNMSCSTLISGRSNEPVDYSSGVSAGACGSPPQTDGSAFGISGGGSGLTYNDDGGGNFSALRTWSETTTTGEGWSTSHADVRTETEYSEITNSRTNTLVSSEAWSTATTADTTDAARLTFNYALRNTGSDMARKVTNLRANILIGDLPVITVNLPDRTDLEPATSKGPFSSDSIPLTLDQLAAIDNGAPIRVVLADYGYDDDLYDRNAWGRSVLFHVDDGIADGDETFDTYLIATNLSIGETYQETLARYFPVTVFDAGPNDERTGTLTSITTPEYNAAGEISNWVKHPVNDHAWWELSISTGGETDGVRQFKEMPAKAKTDVYLRYMVDTDGDGYTDRTERDAGTDAQNPDSHPQPLLVAAKHTEVSDSSASVQLALQNLGDFDASSVEVWAIAPDDSITVDDNLIGGGGRVRAGQRVVLGARISTPTLASWVNSTAKPYPTGQFQGIAPKTYYFKADSAGTVGSTAGLTVSWSPNNTSWTPLTVGSGYAPWSPLALADGVQITFSPGNIAAGETFSFQTALPIDTFTYTINRTPYTPPLLVVSYNDAQGNHKLVTDVEVPQIQENLTQYYADMRRGLQLDVRQAAPFQTGANQAWLTFYNPSDTAISSGALYVEVATPEGTVVKEYVLADQTFQPGPNVATVDWNTADFTPAYDPTAEYSLLVFAADRQGTIIENTVRSVNHLTGDALPSAILPDSIWDFGTVTQGEILERTLSLANIGFADLQSRIQLPAGVTMFNANSRRSLPGDLADFTLTLNTRTLPTGPYAGTVTLRTSDPAHPIYTVQVSGTVAPLVSDAYARKIVDHPLDVEVWVPGEHSHGDWVDFVHPFIPQPSKVHPCKILSGDSSVLFGVGEECVNLSGDIASAELFGNGADGDKIVNSSEIFDAPRTRLGETVGSLSNTVILGDAVGFGVGDELLVIQVQGSGVGNYEYRRVIGKSGNVLTLDRGLDHTYSQDLSSKAQIIRVPNYQDVTITTAGHWIAPAWDGNTGGIIVFRVASLLLVDGQILADGRGFRGGEIRTSNNPDRGHTGEGFLGFYNDIYTDCWGQNNSRGNGGGSGHGWVIGWDKERYSSGGGGGSFSTSGGGGQCDSRFDRCWCAGGGASPTGVADLAVSLFLGGGGGGGGAGRDGWNRGGAGGDGGGIVLISARTTDINGLVSANGTNGESVSGTNEHMGSAGGGGAGGAILIQAFDVDTANDKLVTLGGSGGTPSPYGSGGGVGGQGRIHVEYCDAFLGSTVPSADTRKLNCYIARQVDSVTGVTTTLSLPESSTDGQIFRIQYGRKLDFTTAGEITTTLRVPAGVWIATSLDTLVSGVGNGDVDFKMDVGNDGTWNWEQTQPIDNAGTFSNTHLAAAFTPYVTGTGDKDVEVKVYLSKPGQVLLTNMVVQRNQSVELSPAFALSGTPTEGANVDLNATISNSGEADSGPITVSYYATHGTQQSYIGSVFVSAVSAKSSTPAPFTWNTLGFTGPVTVTAVVDPFNRTAESDESNNSVPATLTILTRPDLAVAAITLSDPEPTAGETVTVTVKVANAGQTAAGSTAAALYEGNPDGGGAEIQASAPSSVAAESDQTLTFTWKPMTPGQVRLFVRTDRDKQVNESNEVNNDAWVDVYVGLASPVSLDSGGGTDAAFSAATGFGYLNGQASTFCGDTSSESQRTDAGGNVQYRFDHLLPGHFYHLDLVLYECDGLGRQQEVLVDGEIISDPVDMADEKIHQLSFLVDPAFYRDRSMTVSVHELLGNDSVVAEIALVDVDYRYADAGGGKDAAYTALNGYGWLDGIAQTIWGTLPYQSRRIELADSDPSDDPDNELRYRFDHLNPTKRYQIHLGFYQASSGLVQQSIALDDIDTGTTVELNGAQRVDATVSVPVGVYVDDGSVVVRITRTNAAAGAFVNEIALEELTLQPLQTGEATQALALHGGGPNWFSFNLKPTVQPPTSCTGVIPTNAFTNLAGSLTLADSTATIGTVVEAYTPRGAKAGCFKVTTAGLYGFMRIYGAEGETPGMQAGEPIMFKVNGIPTQPTAGPVIWQDDKLNHYSDLTAPDATPVEALLAPITGSYTRLLCQDGTFRPPPADPRFNTCTLIYPGQGYLLYGTAAGLSIGGRQLTGETALPLQVGWNWLGYLPSCQLPVQTALANIAGKYMLVHNETGTYNPPPVNPAFNGFNSMAPGLGYMIYMTAAATLTYPTNLCGLAAVDVETDTLNQTECPAIPTANFTSYYGHAWLGDLTYHQGSAILAYSPRGEVVGCGMVREEGLYPYLRVYGTDEDLPGMQAGEPVSFTINGQPVTLVASPAWENDLFVHELDLVQESSPTFLPAVQK